MAIWQCQGCFRFYHDFPPDLGGLACPYCGSSDQELIREQNIIEDEAETQDAEE